MNSIVTENMVADAFIQYRKDIIKILYYISGNYDDSQEAAQTAFLKCWTKKDTWPEASKLRSWIMRVAVNTVRDIRRNAWIKKSRDFSACGQFEDKYDPFIQVENDELLVLVKKSTKVLSKQEKQIFFLRQKEELTFEEIAVKLNIPVGTAKFRMRQALIKVREFIAEQNAH